MELKLKPTTKNQYPVVGVLVKGNSPSEWLQHIEALHVDLSRVDAYAVPGQKANELFGCLLMTKIDKAQINQHQPIVAASSRLLIPQYSDVFPKLTENEWLSKFPNPCLFLPEIGLFELETPLDWFSIFEKPQPKSYVCGEIVDAPEFPSQLKSVQMHIDGEELLKEMESSKLDPADLKNLPFDMEKVIAGNTKEAEKYLKYLESNPDFALKYPFSLDIYGTSRNSSDGVFDFGMFRGWFGGFLNSTKSSRSSSGGFGSSFGGAIWGGESSYYTKDQNFNRIALRLILVFLGVVIFKAYQSMQGNSRSYVRNTSSDVNAWPWFIFLCIVGLLIYLMVSKKLTFGKGTLSRKIAVNACLVVALFYVLNPIMSIYNMAFVLKLIIIVLILILLHKVYNIKAQLFNPE